MAKEDHRIRNAIIAGIIGLIFVFLSFRLKMFLAVREDIRKGAEGAIDMVKDASGAWHVPGA